MFTAAIFAIAKIRNQLLLLTLLFMLIRLVLITHLDSILPLLPVTFSMTNPFFSIIFRMIM